MAQPVVAGISPAVMQQLFAGAPADVPRWLSDEIVVVEGEGMEALAFSLQGQRFISIFVVPSLAFGDGEFLEEWLAIQANGFQPHPHSRLIKFFRAEASSADLFDPRAWSLNDATAIFRFASLLADVVAAHAQSIEPPVRQYFFQPATKELDLLYRRVARRVNASLPTGPSLLYWPISTRTQGMKDSKLNERSRSVLRKQAGGIVRAVSGLNAASRASKLKVVRVKPAQTARRDMKATASR